MKAGKVFREYMRWFTKGFIAIMLSGSWLLVSNWQYGAMGLDKTNIGIYHMLFLLWSFAGFTVLGCLLEWIFNLKIMNKKEEKESGNLEVHRI